METSTQDGVNFLCAEIAAVFQTETLKSAHETVDELLDRPYPSQPARASCSLHDEILACLATSDHPAAIAALVAIEATPWGTNPVAAKALNQVETIIAVATLMGPDGPIVSERNRVGLLFQRANTYYPLHNHLADETYAVIAGRAIWTAGDDTRERGAGDVIHHPSLMPHAFRAGPEGFVALWRWSGDIGVESYSFLPDPQSLLL